MTPAQMHGDTTGGIEWFVSTDGNDAGGDTMRVTEMTNYLSSSPTFTYHSIPVAPYRPGRGRSARWHLDDLPQHDDLLRSSTATAIWSRPWPPAPPPTGSPIPRASTTRSTSRAARRPCVLQGVIDPGPGVSVQMPSVAIDSNGNLGFTWMEASSTEFVSMWVGSLDTRATSAPMTRPPAAGSSTSTSGSATTAPS